MTFDLFGRIMAGLIALYVAVLLIVLLRGGRS